MSIEVKNITKIYGKQKALDCVSFKIKRGEVVGFLGPNGAGKSTMMKIITCFIPPTSGSVKVHDFDVLQQSIEVRKKIGYLPETNPLYLDMYVKEYLEFIAGIHGIKKNRSERISEMIDITGLGLEQTKKIGALSKGYRQRVGLAQTLIHDPDVLILDEPTSGLDPNQLVEIRELIKEVGKEKTIMLSTHIMQEVEAVCDRVIIIDKGKIVADDTTDQLAKLSSGKSVITVEFSDNVSKQLLKTIKDIDSFKKIKDNIWQIYTESGKDIRPIVFQFAVDNKLKLLSMQKEEKSLEQVFRQLTKK